MGTRWQYDIIELKHNFWGGLDRERTMAEFDRMGKLGWEMVSFTPPLAGTASGYAVFKRREG